MNAESEQQMKNLYEIRYYPNDTAHSKHVGYKGKLLSYKRAGAVVRFLKGKKIDAFKVKCGKQK